MQGDTKKREDWVAHKAIELGCICRPVKEWDAKVALWRVDGSVKAVQKCSGSSWQLAAGRTTKQCSAVRRPAVPRTKS